MKKFILIFLTLTSFLFAFENSTRHATIEYSNKLYIFGGKYEIPFEESKQKGLAPDYALDDVIECSSAGECKQIGKLKSKRYHHTATYFGDGKVFIFGGQRLREQGEMHAEIFDLKTNTTTIAIKEKFYKHGHTAHLLPDGRIAIIGGSVFESRCPDNYIEVYDPAKQFSSVKVNLIIPRKEHSSILLKDGKILITGGMYCDESKKAEPVRNLNSVELFDYKTMEVTELSPLLSIRTLHNSILLEDGNVIITGGMKYNSVPHHDLQEKGSAMQDAELYNVTDQKSYSLPKMNFARTGHSMTKLSNGDIAIIGGWSHRFSGGSKKHPITVEIYDYHKKIFKTVKEIKSPRSLHSAFYANGQILLFGGTAKTEFSNALSPEILNIGY